MSWAIVRIVKTMKGAGASSSNRPGRSWGAHYTFQAPPFHCPESWAPSPMCWKQPILPPCPGYLVPPPPPGNPGAKSTGYPGLVGLGMIRPAPTHWISSIHIQQLSRLP